MTTRKLVMVDLENLLGCAPRTATAAMYRTAYANLAAALPINRDDLVVIGVHPDEAWLARQAAPEARIVVRRGADGAEAQLLHELDDYGFLARRFQEIVIASGDHLFAQRVRALNYLEVTITVAALPGHLSGALRLAAQRIIWLRRPVSADAA